MSKLSASSRILILITVALCLLGTQSLIARPGDTDATDGKKVDEIFAQFDKPGLPGCAVGVFRDGSIVYSRGYGESDLERRVGINPSTVFYIASTAKQFTAASIWLLAKQNRLSVEDDVRKYLPEIRNYGSPITIANLLYHTSGLRDYTDLLELAGHRPEEVSTNADILTLTVRQKKLNFPTGTAHQYTNTNYILLAEIVKRVSGKTLRDFARENIFDPLAMKNTQYVDDHTLVIRDRALGYEGKGEGKYALAVSNAVRVGPAGLYTTIEDLAKWDSNFYSGQVGGKDVLERMLTPGKLSSGKVLDYASGLFLGTYRGLPVIRHSGHSIGYRSELLRFPTLKFSVAILCNDPTKSRPERLSEQVADIYLSKHISSTESPAPAVPAQQPAAIPSDQLEAALGDYWNPRSGEVRQMVLRNGQPVYIIDSWSRARLTAVTPTKFRFGRQPNEITITKVKGGAQRLLTLNWYDGRVEVYEELQRIKLTADQLGKYAGRFYSPELDTEYLFEAKNGALLIHRKNQEDRTLLPTVRDSFSEGSVRLRFLRDRFGRFAQVLFSEGDVSQIEFKPDCRVNLFPKG